MMYLMHIAVFVGLLVIAAGIVGLRFAVKERSGHFRLASWILIIGGVGSIGCMGYYGLKYWQAGYFETPFPMMSSQMMSGTNSMMPMRDHMPVQQHMPVPPQ